MNPIKAVINKVKDKIQNIKDDQEKRDKLQKWKNKLERSMEQHNSFRNNCIKWDNVYNGTKSVDNNTYYVSDRDRNNATNDARQVINIVHQLIESQIQVDIPKPSVEIIEGQEDMERKQMIEGMLTYMSEGAELERMTADNERITKKNGLSVFKVMYNPDYAAHSFRGRIETTNPHSTNVIPQQNVKRVEDMDYIFHIETRTIDYVCRRYGEEFRADLEDDSAEYAYLENFTDTSDNYNSTHNNKVSVIECWYKDKDGDICLLTWVNDVILRDEPKFYYKRDEQDNIIETETVQMTTTDPQTQQPSVQDVTVQCHVPKRFPFVIWYNIPREKSYYGKSDVDIISDQQEAIKKVISSQEEKLIKGTSKIFVRKGSGLENKITNATLQVIACDEPNTDVVVKDLKTQDQDYINYYNVMMQAARDTLGVTQAYQGQIEGKNMSGRALQQLSQNSEGRLSVKQFEKQLAFRELYRLYYDFLLAFYDDKVPYRIADTSATPNDYKYGYFDKSKLLKQDAAEEYYYPEFDIYVNTDQGLPKDKNFIIQSMDKALGSQLVDAVEYWTVMESIDFPCAGAILEMERKKQEQAQQQTQQKGPSTSISFEQLPATGKAQLAAQAGIQVDPQEFQQMQMQEQVNKQQEVINQQAMKQPQQQTVSQQQVNQPNPIEQLLSQLNPAEQQAFANASNEQKQAIINQLMGGSNNGM